MKKIWLFLFGLAVVLAACMEDDGWQENQDPAGRSTVRYYGVKLPEIPDAVSNRRIAKGVIQKSKAWLPGTAITVKFLNGSAAEQNIVRQAATEWEQYANVSFRYVTDEDAEVRIGFDWNYDRYITWSYTGTDCHFITDQTAATVNFADWAYTPPAQKNGDALRCLGQVLGLELESRRAGFDPGWLLDNRGNERVIRYWTGNIEDIPWDELKAFVFEPLDASLVEQSADYDSLSIMNWPFGSPIMGAHINNQGTNVLSAEDKTFIAEIYPPGQYELVTAFLKTPAPSVRLTITCDTPVDIDWGDGVRETVPAGHNRNIPHVYAGTHRYTRIYGSKDAIERLFFNGAGLNSLDVTNNLELYDLDVRCNFLFDLDVSQNAELKFLSFGDNFISTIDLSGNPELMHFGAHYNLLSSLDFSNNPNLRNVEFVGNPLDVDPQAMLSTILSMPDRLYGADPGLIVLRESTISSLIASLCAVKNWGILDIDEDRVREDCSFIDPI